MGIFSKPPSARRVAREAARAEEKARVEEETRLRLAEQKLRQRESRETMQGEGIASTGNVIFGTDLGEEAIGNEERWGNPIAPQTTPSGTITREQRIEELRKKLADGEFNIGAGGRRPGGRGHNRDTDAGSQRQLR